MIKVLNEYNTDYFKFDTSKDYTVKSFVNEVIKQENAWGFIDIKNHGIIPYEHGKILSEINHKLLNKKVLSMALGGWKGHIVYSINLEEKQNSIKNYIVKQDK